MDPSTIDREDFWKRCEPDSGCWLWTRARSKDGYGQYVVAKKVVGAHRVAWALENGPIPRGLFVLHRCDNPPCVRPDHLFLGTPLDNSSDMVRKGRARRGAGHMRERSPGAWELRVSAGKDPLTGKYRTITKSVRGTKKQAQAALTALQSEVDDGRHLGTGATLGTLLARWLDQIRHDRSPTTIDAYEGWIARDIGPRLGHLRITALEPSVLDGFYADLRAGRRPSGRPLAPRSVRQIHAIIRAALQQAVRWRWLASNPAMLASPPGSPAHKIRPPAPPDVLRLIETMAARRPDLAVFLRLAAATGARRGELCALRWRHIDLGRGVVVIEASIIETGSGKSVTIEKATKTDRDRKVTVDPETVAILRAWRMRAEEWGRAARRPVTPADWVFPREGDPSQPVRPSTVTQSVRKMRDSLGLAGLTPHSLRHFVASQLLGQGESVRSVADRLGHSDPALTLRVYVSSLPTNDAAAAEVMGRTLALMPPAAPPETPS